MGQKLRSSEDNKITIGGNVQIGGDGVIGNKNQLIKKRPDKNTIGIISLISLIAALITIYLFISN